MCWRFRGNPADMKLVGSDKMLQPLNIAVPWNLSHYIPLDGFAPLYRALFDHAPENISFSAWDNVSLYRKLRGNVFLRKGLVDRAKREKCRFDGLAEGSVARRYKEHFWSPNRVLTAELPGEIEFHHTAPFPSLTRPFIFHCETFEQIFTPIVSEGDGIIQNNEELREHYRRIFAHPLCLGIFSHVPETLRAFSQFFSDPIVNIKLFPSRTGLSAEVFFEQELRQKPTLSKPRFLFVGSSNQVVANFFRRGGHLVLRFWEKFIANGRDGLLIFRCGKPSDSELHRSGVDASWVNAEIGRSIIWDQEYLARHEMNSLMAAAHFFILPSVSLHSASLMEAMSYGTVPIVSDIDGGSLYVNDEEHGIVLQGRGIAKKSWQTEEATAARVGRYGRGEELEDALVEQLTSRVNMLLSDRARYRDMQRCAYSRARERFSGESFAHEFWNSVSHLYSESMQAFTTRGRVTTRLGQSLSGCTIRGDGWRRVFESPTQPLLRIRTGYGVVWELGGAMIHAHRNPRIKLHDWSVLAPYYNASGPRLTFANTISELKGMYLCPLEGRRENMRRKVIRWLSSFLKPFPILHHYAAHILVVSRQYRGLKFLRSNVQPDIELVRQGISGYNIVRHGDRYYAIPQYEGEFSPEKADGGGYSACHVGDSLDEVLRSIEACLLTSGPLSCDDDYVRVNVVVEGFHNFNIVRRGNEFHAIFQSESESIGGKDLSQRYTPSLSGSSLQEVQRKILLAEGSGVVATKTSDNARGSVKAAGRGAC